MAQADALTEARIRQLDQADMRSAILSCPEQITHILDTYHDWKPRKPIEQHRQVVFAGMGGSAIGGDMVRIWIERYGTVPMVVLRGYEVPHWVGAETLVLASSYSGNTEETLAAVKQANHQGAKIVTIASGGQLAQLSQTSNWDYLNIPGGLQPRAAIGYSLAAVAVVLKGFEVLPEQLLEPLAAGAHQISSEGKIWQDLKHRDNLPLRVAHLLIDRLPIIYGAIGTTEALAVRFRGQLAENGKVFASHHVLPEQNHNEIVGLTERIKHRGDPVIIWLSDDDDHSRIELRRRVGGELMGITGTSKGSPLMAYTLSGKGETLIQRNISLLHVIDWISYYVAILGGYDPSAIEILTKLKNEMQQRHN